MQWKSALRFLFCSLLSAAASAGCHRSTPPLNLSSTRQSSVELHIACPKEAAALLGSHCRSWALRKGAAITIHPYDLSNPDERQKLPTLSADVWIIPPADLPRWVAAGPLEPVPGSYRQHENPFAWNDLLPMYREQLTQWDGKAYGFPVVAESPLCCYRADLLKTPTHEAALRDLLGRDLDGPVTWEQFARLAEYFRDKGMNGRPGPSLPPLPKADADLDRLFYTIAVGFARRAVRDDEDRRAYQPDDIFSFHYEYKTGQPRIAAPGFIHALKLMQRLQACRPPAPVDHPEEGFRDGRAVLCLTDAPWLKTFQKTPLLHDKVGVCRVPGGDRYFDFRAGQERQPASGNANRVPYLGGAGWMGVVPRSSRSPEAAFDMLVDLAGARTSLQIFLGATGEGGPTRASQLYKHRWDSFDLDDKRVTQLREVLEETLLHRNLKNPVLCLRTPRQAAHREVLVNGLRKALLKGADAAKTLQNVAEAWRKLDREQGLEGHRADYRRSLGLLAKE